MAELWARLAQQHSGGSRTDVLRGLIWPNALLLVALVTAAARGVDFWVLVLFAILLVLFMVLYAAAYVFFGIQDPNLLRSEKYNLEKLAIERGIYGDSTVGVTSAPPPPAITGGAAETTAGDRS